MKLLIIKTSSMGDVIHTLPAVSDAARAVPGIEIDWVVEEPFAEIPGWHSAVDRVIPVAIRRWRQDWSKARQSGEIRQTLDLIREKSYDRIIDAQGLVKSALLTRLCPGLRCGMDWSSCREPLASLAYQRRYHIAKGQHAIDRVRQLFGSALDYSIDGLPLDYGLKRTRFPMDESGQPFLVFVHGSSWPSKLWPEENWAALAEKAAMMGLEVLLPWGNDDELERARRIAIQCENCVVLPSMNLEEIAQLLANSQGVVGVDTGLSHLTAALDIPSVTLYPSTSPALTGVKGSRQICLGGEGREQQLQNKSHGQEIEEINPENVWRNLQPMLNMKASDIEDSVEMY